MNELEELAKELDRFAKLNGGVPPRAKTQADNEYCARASQCFAAAAAAIRELSAQRSECGYSAVRIADARDATDAAIAAWKGGK